MNKFFCLHCEPTRSGEHQIECPLFTPSGEEEKVVEEYLDLVARFAKLTGMDPDRVKAMYADADTDNNKLRIIMEKLTGK